MSKMYEYFKEFPGEKGPVHPDEELTGDDPVTDCCIADFKHPGWPDSDICKKCGEPATLRHASE